MNWIKHLLIGLIFAAAYVIFTTGAVAFVELMFRIIKTTSNAVAWYMGGAAIFFITKMGISKRLEI